MKTSRIIEEIRNLAHVEDYVFFTEKETCETAIFEIGETSDQMLLGFGVKVKLDFLLDNYVVTFNNEKAYVVDYEDLAKLHEVVLQELLQRLEQESLEYNEFPA